MCQKEWQQDSEANIICQVITLPVAAIINSRQNNSCNIVNSSRSVALRLSTKIWGRSSRHVPNKRRNRLDNKDISIEGNLPHFMSQYLWSTANTFHVSVYRRSTQTVHSAKVNMKCTGKSCSVDMKTVPQTTCEKMSDTHSPQKVITGWSLSFSESKLNSSSGI